ncbi:uncharacterized protein MONOS_12757 [Monocercomonoides exilis]|uniref:uncharacterized protein n=1 Tax=Monocercomonoides exilis TaxID=2049356 RepID=UPI00355A6AC3|nr:hypothetical protein MONOS_12757 [Monocercomonoides exilis]|eukprot:MONOS_12757.1-p1 / transcript=MONOS_12757.1 / gene=MONOS_12757 / organism=Monocercomonoides_exilis_PA203 / gene_product=unspecified product / transcript_product=unspecified product / location=Mono_scaffold00729:27994-28640(+) / protein_length=189 / sequence_SO=supercontig / SO=protein_coding / is_pseudo=false
MKQVVVQEFVYDVSEEWKMNEEGRKARKYVEYEKMHAERVCVRCGSDKHYVSAEVGGGADAGARALDCTTKGQCDEDTERCSGCVWDADGFACSLFHGEWGVCALSGVGGDAGAACVLQPRGNAPGECGSRSRVQKVREEEKVDTLDPFVRTGFKDGRAALMNESRWLNAEDGDSRGLMLTLVALYIF